MSRERDRRFQSRRVGDPFAALVASLSPRVWVDAQNGTHLSLTGALVDSTTDRSGSGNHATQTGANRPSYDAAQFGGRGGIVFAGSQWMLTPAFSQGARVSIAVVFRATSQPGGICDIGPVNSHSAILVDSGNVRARAVGAGDIAAATTYPTTRRAVWSAQVGMSAGRLLLDGVAYGPGGTSIQAATTQAMCIGALGAGSVFRLNGAIGELIWADAAWSDSQMDTMDAALAARWT